MNLEDALAHVGTGPFQWMLLAVCGLANAADAVEILSVGLLGTAAEAELQLTPKRTGALNACIFVGMFLGGLSWGVMGDAIGRKRSLVLALGLNAVFGALSAAATSLGGLMALRLMAGLGVGGSMPVVFALMSEFCPPSSRGKFMAMLASFWMVGSLYSASAGWLLIPALGWRAFVLVASLPAFACCVLMAALVPESPRYLSVMGRGREAAQVLQRVARTNGTSLPEGFAIPSFHHRDQDILQHRARLSTDGSGHVHAVGSGLTPGGAASAVTLTTASGSVVAGGTTAVLDDVDEGSPMRYVASPRWGKGGGGGSWWRRPAAAVRAAAARGLGTLQALLSPPLRGYTLPLAVGWIGLCGGWYCTVLWVPRYFEERGAKGASVYAQTFAVSLANLPGNLASIWLVDRLGRRLTACVCMAGACCCALLFAAAPAQGAWPLLAACVFNGVSVGGWNSLDMISAELYPTSLRSSGFGLLNAIGRVSSFVTTYAAGALLDVALWAPLVVAAVLLAAGSAAMMALPEPAGKPLEDSLCEEDRDREQCQEQEGLLGGGKGRGRAGAEAGADSDLERAGAGAGLAEDFDDDVFTLPGVGGAGTAPERAGLLGGSRSGRR